MDMWRRLAIGALVMLAWPALAMAQTATPTRTPTPTATATVTPTRTPVYSSLLPVGAIVAMSAPVAEPGWLLCNGAQVLRADYPLLNALYAQDGYRFGLGNGTTTFNLPNCRGRNLLGENTIGGLQTGAIGGSSTHSMSVLEMPPHTHRWSNGGSGSAQGVALNPFHSTGSALNTASTGGGQPFNILDPYLVVPFVIWTGTVELEIGANLEFPATPTPLPPYVVYSTVVPAGGGAGQAWATEYSISAGDVLIAALLFAVVVVNIAVVVLMLRRPAR